MLYTLVVISIVLICVLFMIVVTRRNSLPVLGWRDTIVLIREQTSLHLNLEKGLAKCGNLFRVIVPGLLSITVVGDGSVAHQILTQRPNNYKRIGKLEPVAKELSVHGVFSAEGEDWRRQRKLTAPAFTPLLVKTHYDSITVVCDRLNNKWLQKVRAAGVAGAVVDIHSDLMCFTLDVISLIAFGYDLNCLEHPSELMEALMLYMPIAQERTLALIPWWKLYSSASDRKFYKYQELVKALVRDIIKEFYQQSPAQASHTRKSFIHTILAAREKGEDNLSDDEIFGNVITLLVAGQDTTANTLAWSMYYLSRNHDIQERMNQEVQSDSEGAIAGTLPYTNGIVKETLRLRGPSPVMYYEANLDTTLIYNEEKLAVRKGEVFVITGRAITTKEENFPQPKRFYPDRWLDIDSDPKAVAKTSFLSALPFGGGPRVCPGRNLSYFESSLFMAQVCSNFIIRPHDATSSQPDPNLQNTEDPTVIEQLEFTMKPNQLLVKLFERPQ